MITITERAATHIQNFLNNRGKGEGNAWACAPAAARAWLIP